VLTHNGYVQIGDLAGTTAKILTRNPYSSNERGVWVNAPVKKYGIEPVYRITVRRGNETFTFRASELHKHFVDKKTSVYNKEDGKSYYAVRTSVKRTYELSGGDRLASVLPEQKDVTPEPEGMQRRQRAWVVESVEFDGYEEVYCATVEGTGAFAIENGILTHNSWGKAIDAMVSPLGRMPNADQRRQGWEIANWFIGNPGKFGTKYVIWDKLINSGDSRGWRPYTRYGDNPGATLGHYDHVHLSFMHDGGLVVPQLRKGAKIKMDNTLANLHRGETVLTAPLTKALENGVNSVGGGDVYNLEFNITGGNMDVKDLAKQVVFEIEKTKRSKGRQRVVIGE
jgi:hypothetical protein